MRSAHPYGPHVCSMIYRCEAMLHQFVLIMLVMYHIGILMYSDTNVIKKCVPMTLVVLIFGGLETVHSAGPLLPAEETHTTPYLLITSFISSPIRLEE